MRKVAGRPWGGGWYLGGGRLVDELLGTGQAGLLLVDDGGLVEDTFIAQPPVLWVTFGVWYFSWFVSEFV